MLKAYMVHDGDPGQHAHLVFAERGQDAKVMGYGVDDMGCESFLDMRAERRDDLDKFLSADATKPYLAPLEVLREAGWTSEYGNTCGCCGLNDFDQDKWAVCSECDRCPECGHEDDCPNKEAA